MLRFMYVASLAGCLFVATADADQPDTTSAAPTQAYVRINDSGELEVMARRHVFAHREKQRTVMVKETRQEPRNQTVQVTKDGKTYDETKVVTVAVEVMVPKTETYDDMNYEAVSMLEIYPASTNGFRREIDKVDLSIYDLSGNRLSMTTVEDRLHDWTLVLISKTGKALDRRFADLFKPTTIVVGIPPQGPRPIPSDPSSQQSRPATKPAAVRANETRPQLSTSPEPTFAFANVSGEKMIALRTQDEKIHHLSHTISWQKNRIEEGKASKDETGLPQRIRKMVEIHETLEFPTSQVTATKVPNKDVTTAELESVLSAETLAVMSTDGKPVDPFWLQNLREGALVIVAPVDPAWSIPPQGVAFPTFRPGRPESATLPMPRE